jgi:Cysteine-rich CPCC
MSELPHDHPSPEELARREAWSHESTARLENQPPELPLRCPCCGCKTLSDRGGFEICEVCYWEDDGQDDHDADEVRGGPNGGLSLTEARANYRQFRASDKEFVRSVRAPRAEELPDPGQP